MVDIEELRKRYSYNPETGDLIGLRYNKPIKMEDPAVANVYRRVKFGKNRIFVHRIIWALHYGEWPKGQIDHIDHNGLNNKISNLRDVSQEVNQRNQRVHKKSKTGVKGVSLCSKSGGYQVSIRIGDGKRISLGRFKDLDKAIEARKNAEIEYWGSPIG